MIKCLPFTHLNVCNDDDARLRCITPVDEL